MQLAIPSYEPPPNRVGRWRQFEQDQQRAGVLFSWFGGSRSNGEKKFSGSRFTQTRLAQTAVPPRRACDRTIVYPLSPLELLIQGSRVDPCPAHSPSCSRRETAQLREPARATGVETATGCYPRCSPRTSPGALNASLTTGLEVDATDDSIGVGSNVWYARVAQHGPPRSELIDLDEHEQKEIEQIVQQPLEPD